MKNVHIGLLFSCFATVAPLLSMGTDTCDKKICTPEQIGEAQDIAFGFKPMTYNLDIKKTTYTVNADMFLALRTAALGDYNQRDNNLKIFEKNPKLCAPEVTQLARRILTSELEKIQKVPTPTPSDTSITITTKDILRCAHWARNISTIPAHSATQENIVTLSFAHDNQVRVRGIMARTIIRTFA